MIRTAVVSPALAVRAGLRVMLSASSVVEDQADEIQVVYEAASLEDPAALPPGVDVLLVAGEAAIPNDLAKQVEGSLAILVLNDDPQAAQPLSRLPLRAWGILSLECSAEELAAAVRALHAGLLVGTPTLMQPALGRLLVADLIPAETISEPLTEREGEVLGLLARGLANKQIAVALHISEHTVKFHVSSIYTKLGVANRTEAVRKGIQRGLILL